MTIVYNNLICFRGVFIVLTLAGLFSGCNENIIDPDDYGTGEEYEIYRLILIDQLKESNYLIILNDSTSGERLDTLYFQQNIPGLLEETIGNYNNKNNRSVRIKSIDGFDKYVFSSQYHKTGENTVRLWFSRVGFNRINSQAVITVGKVYGPLAGTGYLIFLKKYGTVWKIEKSILTWIS